MNEELGKHDEYIKISTALIYKLIRELKETYEVVPDNDSFNALKKHNLKVKYKLLETLLKCNLNQEFDAVRDVKLKAEIGDLIRKNKTIKVHTEQGFIDYIEGLPEGYNYEIIDND